MNVQIIKPYGFCVGVECVIDMINDIANKHSDMNVFCIGQIVHNRVVIDELSQKGIIFLSGDKNQIIDSIDEGVVVFSAHGTDEKIILKAKQKGLIVYNAMCSFVAKEFKIIKEKLLDGYDVVYIGVKGHEEAMAALSISNKVHLVSNEQDIVNLEIENSKIAIINQTTLSILDLKNQIDLIKQKYPSSVFIDEICGSTRVRQTNLLSYSGQVDGVIIVGDSNSNNTKSLVKISKNKGYDTILVGCYENVDFSWLKNKKNLLLASGASTPKRLVDEIYKNLKKM